MEYVKIKPRLGEQADLRLKCPVCGKMERFALLHHGTELAVLGIKAKKLRDHRTLVCGGCAAVFRLNETASAKVAKGGMHRITQADLER